MTLSEAVGIRLKEILDDKGVSQYYLFKYGGIPRCTVSSIINAKKGAAKLDTIFQIVNTLNMSLQEFFDSSLFDEVTD